MREVEQLQMTGLGDVDWDVTDVIVAEIELADFLGRVKIRNLLQLVALVSIQAIFSHKVAHR